MARDDGVDPLELVSMNFCFTGAPGTGKTTVARRVGRMFKVGYANEHDVLVPLNQSSISAALLVQYKHP